jgi:B9 domain-containing protein 1
MNSPGVTALTSPTFRAGSPRFGDAGQPPRAAASFTVVVRGHIASAQIVGPDAAVCSYEIVAGPDWLMQHGSSNGETQLAQNKAFKPDLPSSVWNFPIELSFKSTNVFGWPRLALCVSTVRMLYAQLLFGCTTYQQHCIL